MSGRQSIEPTYDSRLVGDQYTVEVREGDQRVDKHLISDPFVNTTIHVRGWRNALRVLFRSYRCSVHVGADNSARYEDIAELDDNYKGQRGSTRRTQWDADFQGGLEDFAAVLAEHDDETQPDGGREQ